MHPGKLEYLSTKPPLLPTLLAGLYWLIQSLTGWTLKDNTAEVVRTTLLIVNLLPFVIYLCLFSRLVDRFGKTTWGKLFRRCRRLLRDLCDDVCDHLEQPLHRDIQRDVLRCIRPFESGSIGNTARLRRGIYSPCPDSSPHLPHATSCRPWRSLGFCSCGYCHGIPRGRYAFFTLIALIPIAGYFGTNYMATGGWRPIQTMFDSEWYQFEGSHWEKAPPGHVNTGIDFARDHETRGEYAMHATVGHHGWFFADADLAARCAWDVCGHDVAQTDGFGIGDGTIAALSVSDDVDRVRGGYRVLSGAHRQLRRLDERLSLVDVAVAVMAVVYVAGHRLDIGTALVSWCCVRFAGDVDFFRSVIRRGIRGGIRGFSI